MRRAICILSVLFVATPAAAAEGPDPLAGYRNLATGTIKEVLRSDLVVLSGDQGADNLRYRLENICVPPYEEEATAAIVTKALLGHRMNILTWRAADHEKDRYGVPYGQFVAESDGTRGAWFQEFMISEGLARACSEEDGGPIAALKAIEEQARLAKRGLWQNPAYAIRTPHTVAGDMDNFQIVEGMITDVIVQNQKVYFNFGAAGTKDFSVRIPNFMRTLGLSARKDKNDSNPMKWKGRTVRVRGWVHENNGPLIEVTHAAQLDVIAPTPGQAPAQGPAAAAQAAP